jgi:hypothetical protein
VTRTADLVSPDAEAVLAAARRDALAWVAYPKACQLGTDLNRDSLAALMSERGVRPVRQVSVDGTWSALRFAPPTDQAKSAPQMCVPAVGVARAEIGGTAGVTAVQLGARFRNQHSDPLQP